jgi:ribosomal protein L13E
MRDARKRVVVKTVINGDLITRHGRAYSKSELIQSGVTDIRVARKRKIPIDPFRKTTHKENVEQLKAFLGKEIRKTVRKAKQTGNKNIKLIGLGLN